jgi:PKD repeat protein
MGLSAATRLDPDVILFAGRRCRLIRRLAGVGSLAVAFLVAGDALADADVWTSIGPTGGGVFALAIDPHAPATIYAGTGSGAQRFNSSGGGGFFRTTNGGESWQPAGSGLPGDAVLSLAIDPVTTSTLYLGTRNHGVFKSTDGGGTWTPPAPSVASSRVFAIVVDPATPATIYAGTGSAVLKSTDGAATWTATTGSLGAQPFYALAIDPATPSTLYAGTANNGVFKSVDGAATWTAASSGLTGTRIFTIAIDPKTPSTIYAGTNGNGIFKSTDGAATWKAAGAAAGTSFVIAIDPVTTTTVYACANAVQVLKSLDGVATWNRGFGITSQVVNALAIDPSVPSTVYVGTATGVFKTTNGGVSAQAANRGLTAVKILALAVDPAAPATVYAGTDIGLFKSADAGGNWARVAVSPNVTRVLCLAVLPGSSAILAGMDDGGWRSTDGGATWTHLDTLGIWPFAWTVDPGSPATVYAAGGWGATGPTQGGAAKSTDAGVTWTPYGDANAPLPVFESIVVPAPGATAVVGTDAGVYGIFIHGSGRYEWVTNNALATRVVYALAVDPSSSSIIWAGTDNGLFRSTDGGVSWTPLTNGLPSTTITALKFDPASPSTFYAGTIVGLFRSTDGGASWTSLNAGLTNTFVNAFAIAPGSPPTLYAGTFGESVFRFPTVAPTADFTWTSNPFAGQPLVFTDTSTGSPTSWSWDFGDGGTSSVQNPVHVLGKGTWQVSLTASNAGGADTVRQAVVVSWAGPVACTEDAVTMCLVGARYRVTSTWQNQYAGGAVSTLKKARLTDATGAFFLSDSDTYEYLIRINTATDNGHAWISIPTFTDVEFFIEVLDTQSGQYTEYHSPAGNRTLIYDPYFFVYP